MERYMLVKEENNPQIYVEPMELSEEQRDYKRSRAFLIVLLISLPLTVLLYLISGGNKVFSFAPVALVAVVLSLLHTPFALMVLFFLFPLEGAMMFSIDFSISKAMGIVVLISFVFNRLRLKPDIPSPMKYILALLALSTLSLIWALSRQLAIMGLITLTLNIGMMFILINTINDIRQFRLITWSLLVGAAVTSFLVLSGAAEYLRVSGALSRVVLSEEQNPNVLGNAIVFGLLAGIYVFLGNRKLTKLLLVATGVGLLLALLKTQSRSALGTIATVPPLAFLICARKGHRIKYIVATLLICAIGYAMVHVALESEFLPVRARQRLLETRDDFAKSGRVEQWRKGLDYIAKSPLIGYGIKNYNIIEGLRAGITSAHNSIIELTGELGLIGLVLAVVMYVSLFKYVRGSPYPSLEWLGVACIFFSIVIGLTHTMYFFKEFWYSLSLALLAGKLSESELGYEEDYFLHEIPESEMEEFGYGG